MKNVTEQFPLFPVATFVSQPVVNLPTNPANIDKVMTFVEAL